MGTFKRKRVDPNKKIDTVGKLTCNNAKYVMKGGVREIHCKVTGCPCVAAFYGWVSKQYIIHTQAEYCPSYSGASVLKVFKRRA